MTPTKACLLIASFLCSERAIAQSVDQSVDKEPAAVIELGGAPGWNLKDGGWSFGPTVAVEVTPIENWLELEMGVTASFRPSLDRMGHRPSVQEALDPFRKSGVHVRGWSGVDSFEAIQRDDELSRRRSRAGFYVLAFREA